MKKTALLSAKDLELACELLIQGEVVAFPTETVYGLGARLESAEKIFHAKKRPQDNPLIVHIASLSQIDALALDIPSDFYRLAEAFWPGPLTLILKRHPKVPSSVCAGLETVAIRMPNHPLARALLSQVGFPLVAPSANLSGKPSSTTAQHVLEDFKEGISAILDGGVSEIGIESTVLLLHGVDRPMILRPGAITQEELENVLQKKVDLYEHKKGKRALSPGLNHRHYAPKAKVSLFQSEEAFNCAAEKSKKKTMLLREVSGHELYGKLREADRFGYEEILIFCSDKIRKDRALMDRLYRASNSNTIEKLDECTLNA